MKSFVSSITGIECTLCHRHCEVEFRRGFKGWRWKIQFCPFCGEPLAVTDSKLDDRGYEPDAPEATS